MFDKQLVLEKIFEEAPILSNLRGEIEVKKGEEIEKVPIYAYYFNRGVKDKQLNYDRINNPIRTNSSHTLAEIYSFCYWNEHTKMRVRELEKEGTIKKGEVIYQGPWLERSLDEEYIHKKTRQTDCPYEFFKSGFNFVDHFNEIVKIQHYDLELVDLTEINRNFYVEGACGVKSYRPVNYFKRKEFEEKSVEVIAPIFINLNKEDPSLFRILDEIASAYNRIKSSDFFKRIVLIM